MRAAGARSERPALVAAAASGGALYFLGYLGIGLWPCLLVFLVPLWWALERVRGPLGAAGCGMVFGGVAYAGGFPWLWRLVAVFLGGNRLLGAGLWLAYGAWFVAGLTVYALLVHLLRRRGRSLAVAGVAPLVLVEWSQPQIFPVHAGGGLVSAPIVTIQLADVGGPLLLSVLVAGANVVVFETLAYLRGARARPTAVWAVAATALVVVLGYGWLRIAAVERRAAAAPSLRVGIVQANLGVLEKRMQGVVTHRRHLEQTRELLGDGDLDLVVWPETAYVRGIRRPLPVSGQLVRTDLTVPLLFGGSSVWQGTDGRRQKANSAFLVDADGMIRDAYDKNLLIPLAEYVPLAGLWPGLTTWFPHVEEFRAATEAPPLRLGPWRLATPICYEAARPDLMRRIAAEARPHLLVTLANDAWFGDSAEPLIHLSLARLRAVEHRRYLVRSTNSGISAIVDPAGRIVVQSGVLTRESLRAVVHPLEGRTPYARWGDWVGWGALAVVAWGLAVRGRRPMRLGEDQLARLDAARAVRQ